jgi:hypothetical protein
VVPDSTRSRRALLAAIALGCACATAPRRPAAGAAPSGASSCDALQGTWEGTFPIHVTTADGATADDQLTVRLMLSGERPKVFIVEHGSSTEAKRGSFAARCLGPSAVVHAIDSAEDADGRWVESWVLAVTARDRGELLVRWIRMVNNVALPVTTPHSRFSAEGVGVLRSVAAPPLAAECLEERTPDGSTTIGELLERECSCGNAGGCELLAALLEREGGAPNLQRAEQLRQKACALGQKSACRGK